MSINGKSLIWLILSGLSWSAVGEDRVTLAWDPNSESDLAGYIFYHGDASRHYTNSTDVGNVTQYTVVGLQEGQGCYFAVTAYNTSELESDYSNEVFYMAPLSLQPWRSRYFSATDLADTNQESVLWGNKADPDHDGRGNLLEYALDLNPIDPSDRSQGIQVTLLRRPTGAVQLLCFNRRVDDPSLSYIPEVSQDGAVWSSEPADVASTFSFPVTPEHEWAFYLIPVTPSEHQLIRLKVRRGAEEAISEEFVTTAKTIAANNPGGSSFTFGSLTSVQPVAAQGVVSALVNNELTDTRAAWADAQFNGHNGPHYVEFDSGWTVDIVATRSPNQLTLAQSVVGSVAPSDVYRIRKHTSVVDLLGKANETGLLAGPELSSADNLLILTPETQQIRTLFYCNRPGLTGWLDQDYQPAADSIIYPYQGFMIEGKSGQDLVILSNGMVKRGATIVPIYPGFNLVGTGRCLRALRLADAGLYTGQPHTGITAAASARAADYLGLWNTAGFYSIMFYFDWPGISGWMDTMYRPAGDTILAPGDAFLIVRRNPLGAFSWLVPGE